MDSEDKAASVTIMLIQLLFPYAADQPTSQDSFSDLRYYFISYVGQVRAAELHVLVILLRLVTLGP